MLRLYQYATCPYCQMVIRTMKNLGLAENKDFVLVEASRGTKGREEVVSLGGMSQVPFLVDGDTKMYESDDIITYLQKKYS
ncbi:glutathione S-transferase N-terminal domain-containing protein [Leptospira ilyithenensis]|uniref:Glutaredoxin n=1 Tax=Leptospira ilyithenensis TaxID=2484901 RepID=A0A4V6QMR9_9LEPT|nr:glutathione S-transferase N-terminal domain-containing protein [Leptospira ilyithenensis]TGN08138.1 glutaredoxin [Leptospira ilyithenensis]